METRSHLSRSAQSVPAVSEVLARSRRGERLDRLDAICLLACDDRALEALCERASELRDGAKGRVVTFSPKVFLPITNLCRDRCRYCTFRKDPWDDGAWTMTEEEVRDWSRRGAGLGCREALMCLGDRPETAFRQYRALLSLLGHASTVEYVHHACEIALEENLWPHTNAGVMTAEELEFLKPVNVSMGLMLENVSPRLRARGGPHHAAPDKDPTVRLRTICDAGELRIPFTTGILIGIGETLEERADSLLAIREVDDRYGHIQEVIVQNFRRKPEIPMHDAAEPDDLDIARTVATARLVFGGEMNLQAPPNLNPTAHRLLLSAGINDWGGISPLTADYVNPEAPWPHVARLAATCAEGGFTLLPRLAVYPEFIEREGFLDAKLRRGVIAEQRRLTRELLEVTPKRISPSSEAAACQRPS
ncbi:MAG TPA: 7,8-didemethyl-8-hydroxy-5-deazariboflavin synthase CofG [Candidatus Binatia bacterium]|nr:7,8-didemethyl-8-hydroxy-5-deazariboflavin synthase CofG [Candidatus Binatia bacterium]